MDWKQAVQQWLDQEERSQSYLARKARVDQSYLSTLLGGSRTPGERFLRRLETAMGLEAGTLMVLEPVEGHTGVHVP